MLLVILVILVLFAIGGGAWGYPRYGGWGWSPLAVILIVVLLLWLLGGLH